LEYDQIVDYLFNQFPNYHNKGKEAYKPGLERITALCEIAGNPQEDLKFIHVAGTNGKGSVCHMIGSVLIEAEYKTGIFSSPHLVDFRERFRINGEMISKSEVKDFFSTYHNSFEEVGASFFEWCTVLAFWYFKKKETDYVILETGLGGRLDSTNVVNPLMSIITRIDLDHQNLLGNTIEKIAIETAGIIKEDRPNVVGSNTPNVIAVIKNVAVSKNASLSLSEESSGKYELTLKGDYQKENLNTVLKALEVLNEHGVNIDNQSILNGLKSVQNNTGLKGRWEILSKSPLVIADIGHNVNAMQYIVDQLTSMKSNKIHFVFGMVADKDIQNVVKLLPKDGRFYLGSPKIKRAVPSDELSTFFEADQDVSTFDSCKSAFKTAINNVKEDEILFIGGSNFVVSEIILHFFS